MCPFGTPQLACHNRCRSRSCFFRHSHRRHGFPTSKRLLAIRDDVCARGRGFPVLPRDLHRTLVYAVSNYIAASELAHLRPGAHTTLACTCIFVLIAIGGRGSWQPCHEVGIRIPLLAQHQQRAQKRKAGKTAHADAPALEKAGWFEVEPAQTPGRRTPPRQR